MSEINPNIPVTGSDAPSDSISLGSGDSPASFDELDEVLSKSDTKASKATKEERAAKKAEKKDTSDSKDLRPDAKTKDVEAKKAEGKEAGEKEGDGKTLEKPKPRKTFKGKHADQELDLDEEAEFSVKVNGQEMKVKAKDLFENYSGKTAWDKKFSEVDQMRRGLRGSEEKIQSIRGQIKDMFMEKDATKRLFKMAHIAGVSPIEFRQQFFNDAAKDVEKFSTMTEDERKAADLEFENQYLKHQQAQTSEAMNSQQAQRELETQVQGLLQTSGVPIEKFVARLEEVITLPKEHVAILEREGKFQNGKPTPQFVIETIEKEALYDAIENSLEGIKLDWDQTTRAKNVLDLVDRSHRDGFKAKDMAYFVSELWGKGKTKKMVERIEKERDEHYNGTREVIPHKTNSADVLFFDDLT